MSSKAKDRQKRVLNKVKVILLGNVGVGKTSLLLRLKGGTFHEESDSIGLDKFAKPFRLGNGETVTVSTS